MGCILKGGGGLYSRVVVGAVLLAAGEGRRMGGKPKSLLELGGVSLIRRQLIALSGAGVDELVVVLGHYADDIEPQVRDFPVTIVRNPDPSAGQISSLRCGLAALTGKLDAVMIALADQPLIHAQDISDLIGAYKKRPESTQVVYPEYEGQRGNPVIISADVKEAILKDGANVGCRQWQAANPDQVHVWASSNRRYVTDVDSIEDIAALKERTGHQLVWPSAWQATTA
ncbi:MAG: Bifunctional protein GlmU [Pseudomonadota bacterium]